jgi:hypothetical protein
MEVRRMLSYDDARQVSEPLELAGRKRLIVFVSGPNAREGRAKYPKSVAEDLAEPVRSALAAASA